jgi:hypothetical protein
MLGYYITKFDPTIKVEIFPQETIALNYKNIIELVLPECKVVRCYNNQLTKLVVPDGCKKVNCDDNQLTELILPNSCEFVSCENNKLTELILHENCEIIYCAYNKLTKLILPKNSRYVYCGYNKLHPQIEELINSTDPVKRQLANSLQVANSLQL